ncbi:MAG TPA: diguanylate cyclase [Burkholderiales bacterium]|nr:diguanylate cyclase [Burkholderiales bacterium]
MFDRIFPRNESMVVNDHFSLSPVQPLDARVRVERLRMLCEQAPLSIAAQLLAAGLVVLAFRGHSLSQFIVGWASYMALVNLCALLICARYYGSLPPPSSALRWERAITLAAGLIGLGWGVLGVFVFPRLQGADMLLLGVTFALVAAGGVVVVHASRTAFIAYAAPIFIGLSFSFVDSPRHPAAVLLLLILVALVVWISARSGRILRDALHWQFHHEALLEEVSAAELSLKIALDEHRLMFDAAPVGIAVIRDHRIVRCNRRLEEMLGYRRGGLVGLSTRVLYADDHSWQDSMRAIEADLNEGGAHEEECNLYRRDGTSLWCRHRGHVVDRRDLSRGAMWLFEDLSEKRAAAERLSQVLEAADAANARLHDAIESVSDAFALFDAEDRLVLCNGNFARTFTGESDPDELRGLTAEALVRLSIAQGERIPPQYGNDVDAWVAERVRHHRNPHGDGFVFQLGDGRWVQAKERRTSEGGIVGVHADITTLKAVEEQVRHLANHDPLTGLPNRRLLHDRMTQAFSHAKRHEDKVAIMVIDLDEFKRINDIHGHKIGDRVLQVVSGRLRTTVRQADTVARMGGDEFVVVLPELQQPVAAARVAEKVLYAVARPIKVDGHNFQVRASIGIAVFPADGEDVETLLKCADAAMYNAKQEGRNVFNFYSEKGRSAAA